MPICPKCGSMVTDQANFCSNCGSFLKKDASGDIDFPENIRIYTPSRYKEASDVKIYIPSSGKTVSVKTDGSVTSSESHQERLEEHSAVVDVQHSSDPSYDDSDVKVVETKVKNGETHIWTVAEVEALRKKADAVKLEKEEQEKEKKVRLGLQVKKPSPKTIVAIALAAVIIIGIVIGISLPDKTNYIYRNNFLMLTHNGNGELKLYKNGQLVSAAITSTTHIDTSAINASGSVVAAITKSSSEDGSLYYSEGKKLYFVSDNVSKMEMAADSGNIIYLVHNTDAHDLYLFDGKNSSLIDTDVGDNICISPDGCSAGYVKSDNSGNFSGFIYMSGTVYSLGTDKIPFAIADKNEYVYYFMIDGKDRPFFVQKGVDSLQSVKLASSPVSIFFNASLSEVVFTDNNVTYLSEKAGDKTIISQNGGAQILLPYGCSIVDVKSSIMDAYIYSTTSFRKGYIICSDALYYLPKKQKAQKVISGYDQIYLSNDGNTVFYLKNGDIRSIDGRTPNVPPSVLAGNAYSFTISANGEYVYYVSDDYELMCKKGKDNPVLLSETPDVVNLYSRHVFNADRLVFFVGNTIYIANGSNIKTVSSEMDYISSISANKLCIFIHGLRGGENVYYVSGDGKNYLQY